MKVAVVVSSLEAGGTERFSTLLAGGLVATGHDVVIVTLGSAERQFYDTPPGVDLVALGGGRLTHSPLDRVRRNVGSFTSLHAALNSIDADVIVALGWSTNVITLIASRGLRTPVVISERSDPRGNPISIGWRLGRRLTYPFARRLVTQTDTVAGVMRHWLPSSRLRVIPNPVLPRASQLRWAPSATPTIAAMGRMSREKGFDTLVDAFAIVHRSMPEARLVLIGDGPLREQLSAQAAALGIVDAVSFPGRLSDPHPTIAAASCFVLPSRLEGFPNALLEAMAIGVPCVAADCQSGPRELLGTEAGLLVPVDDHEAMATAMLTMLTDQAGALEYSARSRRRAGDFEATAIIARWADELRSIQRS